MYKYHCLNPIAQVGLEKFDETYVKTETPDEADAILVRSAGMHEMEFAKNLKAIARAGAGVNNIPLDKCADQGIVVFNTPGANANGVKELVIAGMLLAARDIVGGIGWVQEHEEDGDGKSKESICGYRTGRKEIRSDRSGSDRRARGKYCHPSWNGGIWLRSICFRRFRMETFQKYSSRKNGGRTVQRV